MNVAGFHVLLMLMRACWIQDMCKRVMVSKIAVIAVVWSHYALPAGRCGWDINRDTGLFLKLNRNQPP